MATFKSVSDFRLSYDKKKKIFQAIFFIPLFYSSVGLGPHQLKMNLEFSPFLGKLIVIQLIKTSLLAA